MFSDRRTVFTEGKGIRTNPTVQTYSSMTFEFTGTGFDIIARTGTMQGNNRATIYTDEEREQHYKVCQSNMKGNSELAQIPVISLQDLPHGHYYVDIGIAAPYDYGDKRNEDQYGGALDRGSEFHFDTLRIFAAYLTSTGQPSKSKGLTSCPPQKTNLVLLCIFQAL